MITFRSPLPEIVSIFIDDMLPVGDCTIGSNCTIVEVCTKSFQVAARDDIVPNSGDSWYDYCYSD